LKKYVKYGLATAAGLTLLTALPFSYQLWQEQQKESPHYRAGACMVCHSSANDTTLKTDELTLCTSCHDREGDVEVLNAEGIAIKINLGLSHPWGIVPVRGVPQNLPLSPLGQITCQTCHDVHSDNATNRMVRLCDGKDFTPLCHDCHAGY
jgi:predicted CXXCH cytochrome family protein